MNKDNPLLNYFRDFKASGNLKFDVKQLLMRYNHESTYYHSAAVANKAKQLAEKFNGNIKKVQVAAWLHDISAIVPNENRIEVSTALKIPILPEEEIEPVTIHQKLSAVIAQNAFDIDDLEILSAIRCHTTLRAHASLTDKIVFLADKISWDQQDTPSYLSDLLQALEKSIDSAVMIYLNYLYDSIKVLHPWVISAREYLLRGPR